MSIKMAVVGYGAAGQQHVDALFGLEKAELYCVFESNENVDTGEISRKSTWQDVLHDERVDAVALCVPPGGRAELASQAMLAGKSVLLEKPPCLSESELELLLETAIKTKTTLGVMLQHRYRLPKEILEINWNEKTTAILEVSRPRESSRYFTNWRQDPLKSLGGITAHLGVHYLDLACLMLGEPISLEQSGKRNIVPGVDLRTTGSLKFLNGSAMAFIVTGEASKRNERLAIFGDDNHLIIENGHITLERNGEIQKYSPGGTTLEMRKRCYEDFANAVINKAQPQLCNLQSVRGVTKILEQLSKKEM